LPGWHSLGYSVSSLKTRVLTKSHREGRSPVALKLRPLADRVVIKPLEREEMTKSGIVLPDTAKEKPQEGTVEAVGSGRYNEQSGKRVELDVKVGDRVMYAKYAGSEVKIDEVEYLILSEKDILAVVGSNGSN
jgi:chaperonin GroES